MKNTIDYKRHNTLRIFAHYYKPHVKLFVLDMVCALMIAAVDVAFPLLTRYTLNNILPQNLYGVFFALMAALLAAYVMRSAFMYIVTYWGHLLGVRLEADIRQDLFRHLHTLPYSFFDANRTGHIMSHVTNDLFDITELAHHGPEDVLISIFTLLGAFGVLFTVNWQLSLLLLCMVPIALLFTITQRRRMTKSSLKVKQRTADISADIESSISGVRLTKAFSNEAYEIEKFEEGNERFKQSKSGFYSAMGVFHSGMEFIMSAFSVAVLVLGGVLIMRGSMNVVDMLTFTLYVGTFLQPVKKLTQFVEQYTAGMAGFKRFLGIMRLDPDITDSPDARDIENVKGSIEFQDVSFAYNDNSVVLQHINLHIPAGKTLAIVGPSGGGKTTLCNLIPRFYETTHGAIRIDGVDIRDMTLSSLRRSIGIVSQDVFLFASSVRENIRYGRTDATDEEILEAAKSAQIYDAIMSMPDGLDTPVGERGIRLSGGQKQRISIARVLLKNPPILILDEATSALDTVTEHMIQEAFDELSKGRTTLVIAHRLSTVQHADEIIYIDEQGVREQGTHDELLAQDGLYANLYHS